MLVYDNPSSLLLKTLEWDTEQLGISCGELDVSRVQSHDNITDTLAVLSDFEKFDFIVIKIDATQISLLNLLLKQKAKLIDAEMTLKYTGKTMESKNQNEAIQCQFCTTTDPRVFCSLAEQMKYSRFYQDENIPEYKTKRLWTNSIINHCQGFSDLLVIGFWNKNPSGLVTLKFHDNKSIYLHIVGVLPEYQGRGIAQAMIREVINQYAQTHNIYIEVSVQNNRALRVYQKAGFNVNCVRYIVHYWKKA